MVAYGINIMHLFRFNVPYLGSADFEWGGASRGRFPVDAALNPDGVELWAGKMHIYLDQSHDRMPRLAVVALFLITIMVPPEWLGLHVDHFLEETFGIEKSVARSGPKLVTSAGPCYCPNGIKGCY